MVAPVDAFQSRVGLVETPVAPVEGETIIGGLGMFGAAPDVVKFAIADQALVSREWTPRTLQ